MSPDVAYILLLAGFVLGGLALGLLWLQSFANLLWMSAIRPYVVAATVLVSVLIVATMFDCLIRRQGLPATRFVILLVLSPILAQPLANIVARWRAKAAANWKDPLARHYIFKVARQAQQDAFVASLAPPASAAAPPGGEAAPRDT